MADQNSQYMAMLTAVGEAKLANATALGVNLNITQLGVGDANGVEPMPSRTQTTLINERRRAPLNQLSIDPNNSAIIIAEQVIPEDIGGWWIREIGLYDEAGDLVAVSNCPPTFKPELAQGSGRTQVVRLNILVSSTQNIQLKIDPSVVLATRSYVDTAVTAELAKLDIKQSVLAATTDPNPLIGAQDIDGVIVPMGARVLVKNQVDARSNGIYVVGPGAWQRAADADASLEVTPGMLVTVEQGTVNGDSVWQLVSDGPVVLGTTGLTFEMAVGRTSLPAGTYRSVTVDKRGRVVGGTNPTSLAEYGISPAGQFEAEEGENDEKPMTPLGVARALAKKFVQATEAVIGVAKIASQEQVEEGSDDSTIVTPKKLRFGFAYSFTPNGYLAMPSWLGGFILQWGNKTLPLASSVSADITFPIAFPNACYHLSAGIGIPVYDYDASSSYRTDQQSVSYGMPSTTGCEGQAFSSNNISDARYIQWWAVGR